MPRKSLTYVKWITHTKSGDKSIDKQPGISSPQDHAAAQLPADIERQRL
jgi:hypothetical protein